MCDIETTRSNLRLKGLICRLCRISEDDVGDVRNMGWFGMVMCREMKPRFRTIQYEVRYLMTQYT